MNVELDNWENNAFPWLFQFKIHNS
jgi:hypothetical protein